MGRGGRGSPAPRRPVDVTGAISPVERNDLVTLINAITEKLHNDISIIFDSPPVTPILGDQDIGHHQLLALSLRNTKENANPKLSSQVKRATQVPQPSPKVTESGEKGDAEITPQLRELKKEALLFYRKWQTITMQRFRDLSVMEANAPQTNIRGRGRGSPLKTPSNHIDRDLSRRFPPIPTSLWTLPVEKRKLLLHISLLMVLSLQEYSAYARLLLLNLTSSLNLPLKFLQEEEKRIAQGLSQLAVDVAAEQATEQKQDETKPVGKTKARLASMTGPFRLGAQLIAAGIGTTHGGHGLRLPAAAGLLGPMSDNGIAAGSLFGIYGTRPTGKMIESFSREIQDFGIVPIRGTPEDYVDAKAIPAKSRRLRVIIAVNGWVTEKEDIARPWKYLGDHAEVYVLRWEMSALQSLGGALETVVRSSAWAVAKKAVTSRTTGPNITIVFTSLIEASWPAELMKVSKIIDNPWSIGMVRAEKAGVVLADAIMRSKIQGDRPVSLMGYSLAARAIYVCLMVLAERRQFGIVDSVVLMGTPAPSESRVWLTLKSVVSGRLVNVYSESDYLLGFLYRTSNIHFGVAGLQQIQGADGVENHNVSDLVKGHLRYSTLTGKILKDIGWEDLSMDA
ncbi:uncharacterized protein NECHADRAFT_38994 [Fusarium vanettenii 77-13-4]|uniref:DUF726 domain protein n=1 Tax=Fusarium vanettenii (strain ATCC MYA-4622 / CBS 123669 / FGSC 9596 / NRRL 45880 / 77-13-4) TaxID=660122 RepID=C7YPE9_FUSV7|nr:uncharacterized protein NECHADRAFT_38994 [Fusarium vanettenii 77-13-4]EEU45833.1 hypothetical protein NECHADRAFT_38994 [Fusarium vanettenii 77-13-4]